MPGPPPKPAHLRQRTNKRPTTRPAPHLVVVDGAKFETPEIPAKLAGQRPLKVTEQAWDGYWADPVARAAGLADMPAVVRWVTLIDELERTLREYRKERLVTGSMGQVVLSPLWSASKGILVEIRQLEDRLGMSPMARLRLQIDASTAAQSIDQANAAIGFGDDIDEVDEDDPRLGLAT